MEYDNPYNTTFVVGPWASKTFPSSPWTTGRFHWLHPEIEEEKEPWLASIDCPMSKATVLQCSKIRGFGARRQTLAVPGKAIDGLGVTFDWVLITITAGQNFLYRDSQATPTDDTPAQSASEALETGSTSEVEETGASSREATATETSSSAAAP
ncbi:hypothetical protein FALBO_6495 [Fusarium albosuccineum]|uniref:Uncharacterized protein n=1 Tax=Fusarium albosuccineum TaxID=1237068 RepID=A0A8H4LEF9_9HYPO|nr:hypothetical protein FALBO_6495 [Fusarium albosuccineum]